MASETAATNSAEPALRRIDLAREPAIDLGPVRLEPPLRRLAHRDGREETLEPRVMQVLVALGRAPRRILTRDDLVETCWAGVVVGEDAITRVIGKLRRLSEQIAADAFEIETITKVGYRLLPRWSALPVSPEPEPAASAPDAVEDDPAVWASPADGARRGPLLAVLPFDNLSTDKEMDFFSDGVAEEIHQALSRSRTLRLIARSSAFQCRGPDKAVRHVRRELGVSHMLDGSVRRSGMRVRISAQLVDCATGEALWSDRFDGGLDDIFGLQDEIAAAVAAALEVVLTPAPAATPLPMATYELFLRAQAIISEGGRAYDESGARATPLLEQVVIEAPEHARAWELLANARAWTLRQGDRKTDYVEARVAVLDAAQTALRLDPGRGGAYEALTLLEPFGAYAAREALLETALRISPNEPGLLTAMAEFCWGVGRIREALDFAERACAQNPLMPAARLMVAQLLAYTGDYERSVRMHDELRRRWPDNYAILQSQLNYAASLGFWDEYDAARADAPRWADNRRLAKGLEVTLAYGETVRTGDPERRQRDLDRLRAYVATSGTIALNRLSQLCHYGMDAEALKLAEAASFDHMFEPDGPFPSTLFPGSLFGSWTTFNRNPRFIDLCRRLGLCDYWLDTGRWPDCAGHLPYDFKGEAARLGRR
jgi:TolB-like protein/tetratricopeptide (TPR) repeat protein